MVRSDRSSTGSERSRGGAFLARDVMMLAYHLSQITKEEITLYNLDQLGVRPNDALDRREDDRSTSSSRSHIVELHRRLQRHLEDTTIELLKECEDLPTLEVDTNRIANELETHCLENSSVSLRRLKAMLYTGMQHFDRLPACLQLLLHLKNHSDETPTRSVQIPDDDDIGHSPDADHNYQREPSDATSDSETQESSYDDSGEPYPDDRTSLSTVTRSVELPSEESAASRIVTNRFEFAQIEEPDLVNDVLFVLQGVEGRFIKRDQHGRFTLTSDRKVSRGVRQLTNRICSLGQIYNSIVNVNIPSGIISNTLYQAVMEQVHQYNRLVNLLASGKANKPLSLRQIYVWAQQPYTRIRLLHLALESSSGFSIDNIFGLYCRRGDAMGRELYNELLRKCLVPYLEILLQWVYFGDLKDAAGAFFVRKSKEQWQLVLSKVPKFMSSSLARMCFDVGRCSSYCTQLKSNVHTKGNVSIIGIINQLCQEAAPSWSLFVTIQHLGTIVSSIGTSKQLSRVLLEKYALISYIDRVRRHLAMEYLAEDKDSEALHDFELSQEYGFDIYVPNFSFPLNLVLEDEKLNRETYIRNFRLQFLLERTLKLLSICWSEYSWNSRCSRGSLELSKRLNWINLRRNEMSHFCHVLQSGRNVQFVLQRFIASKSTPVRGSPDVDLKDLQGEYSKVLSCLSIENFLELMEILECIVDYCKLIPRLFNATIMKELRLLIRERASPAHIIDFIHRNIATEKITKILSHHAKRFRENVMHLLHRLSGQDSNHRLFGKVIDYNNFYRLCFVLEH